MGANTSAKQLAAAGAPQGKPPPFWETWGQQWNTASQNMRVNASTWVKGMESRAKTVTMPKFEMPGACFCLFFFQRVANLTTYTLS